MCYRFELLEFEDCLFENVDATYILHLEGNGRIDHIHDQLKTYHPSKKVYIVYNKGYKQCKKDIHPQETHSDLVHANMTVFEHAQQYKHVLVLEDDFIFSKDIISHAKHVDVFLKRDFHFVYQLGSLPLLAIPIDGYHYRHFSYLAHANIYSPLSRKTLLKECSGVIHQNIDSYVLQHCPLYMYYKPLCYQTFPSTNNRKTWFMFDDWRYYIAPILQFISDTFITWTNLETDPIVGFSIMYFFAKLIPFVLLFLLWILLYIPCKSGLKGKRVR